MSSLIVDKDFRNCELWNGRHAAGVFALHVVPELPRPIYGVEETHNNVAAHCFFNTLQASAATEELVKPIVDVSRGLYHAVIKMKMYLKLLLSLITL
jgi:hypothetical protein